MQNGAKKSFYVFLAALLGVLLFLMIDRVIVFFYLFLIAGGYVNPNINYTQFLIIDYFTLTIVLMLGAWYGIWLGLYWFKKVYEEQSHQGFIHHLSTNYFPARPRYNVDFGVSELKGRLQSDLDRLDNLIEQQTPTLREVRQTPAIKRTVIRKKAPRKLNSLGRSKPKTTMVNPSMEE